MSAATATVMDAERLLPAVGLARDALGPHLVKAGKLSAAALERAQRLSSESGGTLEVVLARLGLVAENDLAEALAELLDLPLVSSGDFPQNPVLEDRLNPAFLRRAQLIPLDDRDDGVAVAVVDPLDAGAIDSVRFAVGKPVRCHVMRPADFEVAYDRLYGDGKSQINQIVDSTGGQGDDSTRDDVDRLKDVASEAPVIRLVNHLVTRAVEARASDIHIEPMDGELRVRYRIDGVLHEVEAPPQRLASAVISRLKIMAKLNIAERRLPLDGRIRLAVRGQEIDLRVSTTPTIHGESVVLRVLDRGNLRLDFADLGFEDDILRRFREVVNRPHGILLVTGPTGSGKTTTLYTALVELNTAARKILTIEDPVEYQIRGVNQVQVKPEIGLTFAEALRSFLRHDPNILMIGEIRNLETAQIAVQAALVGRLVLSTLHTNDAPSAVTRLLNMGIEEYLLTSTVNGIVAQRLVRALCVHCRAPYEPAADLVSRLDLRHAAGQGPIILYRAIGCKDCGGTGYRGRSAIVEVMEMTDALRELVLRRAEAGVLRRTALDDGMQTMQMHGMRKALAGQTTVEEVLRVTREV